MGAAAKAELAVDFFVAKQNLRAHCVKQCLRLDAPAPALDDEERACLQHCAAKMHEFLQMARKA